MSTLHGFCGSPRKLIPQNTRLLFVVIAALAICGAPRLAAASSPANVIMIMGDSLSAAYGIQREQGWVSLLKQKLERETAGWEVANESISGETTDGGLRRLPALLEEIDPEVVVLELGGNDGLRGFPPQVIRDNLSQMIELSLQSGARVLLIGMQIPPNYGSAYTAAFSGIYPTLAEEYEVALVPFFLEGVYDREGWMQPDGVHPTRDAQPQLLENVWPELGELLEAESAQTDPRNRAARTSDQ